MGQLENAAEWEKAMVSLTASYKQELLFFVNGVKHIVRDAQPDLTLLQYLRGKGLTGTKLGCGEGGCGACTVMVSTVDPAERRIVHRAVNACLAPLCSVDHMAVTTVEGIGSVAKGLHPVQDRMARSHGSQCGFCTPGIVMAMYALLRNNPKPSMEDIEEHLDGNLCRCTGYRPILDAFKSFAIDADPKRYGPANPMVDSEHSTNEQKKLAKAAASAGSAAGPSPSSTQGGCGSEGSCGSCPPSAEKGGCGKEGGCVCQGDAIQWTEAEEKWRGKKTSADTTSNSKSTPSSTKVKICPGSGKPCACGEAASDCGDEKSTNSTTLLPGKKAVETTYETYNPGAEAIFPPSLMLSAAPPLLIKGRKCTWFRPTRLEDLLQLKGMYPTAKLIVGNTEIGIEMKFKNAGYPIHISTTHIKELNQMIATDKGLDVGGSVTLTRLLQQINSVAKSRKEYEMEGLRAVQKQLKYFASTQIRNVASVAGNIVTASPISDLNPVHMAVGSVLTVVSTSNIRRTVAMRDFFVGYRKTLLRDDEIVLSVHIPYTQQNEHVEAYKQARRRDDDIAIVNASYRVHLVPSQGQWIVQSCSMAYGGMAPMSVCARKTEQAITGKAWDESTLKLALATLEEDLPLSADAPGGMIEYRRSLTTSFFFKYFWLVTSKLPPSPSASVPSLPHGYESLIEPFHRPVSSGLQHFDLVKANGGEVGKPQRHMAAEYQVTGEAQYCDDIQTPPNTLFGALVLSTRPHANILSIDTNEALKVEGVVAFFGAGDVPSSNAFSVGPVMDEEVFAAREVKCVGQVIGLIVGESDAAAQAGARAVKVSYEDLPALLTIKEAINANSYFLKDRKIERGNVDEAMAKADHVIEGEALIGGQEHFYLETNATIAMPGENNEMVIISSTQNPAKTQFAVAKVLGIPANRVTCKIKRLGGGFGGKESRNIFISTTVAVAAHKLRRPVRISLDRDVDMLTTGTRHPFLGKYKVGLSKDGMIQALDVTLWSNGGCTLDLSQGVLERAVFHSDNSYYVPNMRASGNICKTNLPSNTAFRGFGGPQGMMVVEMWIDHAASALNIPAETLRAKNLYREGETTHYNMPLEGCHIRKMWSQLETDSSFQERAALVQEFNLKNRFKKRGIAMIPTKFGMSFTFATLNQAGALVHVYMDGSVMVTHGGTEMGQGLHTKVCAIAADALGVPIDNVYIQETSTDKVPNTSPTAASVGSDLNGMAVLEACKMINDRLQPIRAKLPSTATFAEIAHQAWFDRVDLSAHGFYKTPGIDYDWVTNTGNPFYYFCYGVACAEVEVDCLTGDHVVLRADIIHDVGQSLNPAIDIGQIEGGFVQGMGLFTLEELVWSKRGYFTRGPSTYKIPSFNDIPVDLRTSLLKGAPSKKTVHSSKGVGEPPLFLAASVFFAIKNALQSARHDVGRDGHFVLDSPATCERIRMAAVDDLTSRFAKTAGEFRPAGCW